MAKIRQNQQRFDNVLFEFLSAGDEPVDYRGTVIVRALETVLELEVPDCSRPYLIKGKPREGFWAGRHEGLPDDVRVEAKWTRLDDVFIGTWVEEGIDYVFTFRLPGITQARRPGRSSRPPRPQPASESGAARRGDRGGGQNRAAAQRRSRWAIV